MTLTSNTPQIIDLKTEILCTLGPSSMTEQIIRRLDNLGVSLFRINLSHTKAKNLAPIIDEIQSHTNVPICLDTEGAQIRTGDFVDLQIQLRENSIVRAQSRKVPGDQTVFNFYPLNIVDKLEIGDFISIDFNSVLVQVIDKDIDGAVMRVINGGLIGRNKAVTIDRKIEMSALTENDLSCLKIGTKKGLTHYALSFASCQKDVTEIRHLTGKTAFIISKIESLSGLSKLDEIAKVSSALLIDRGDLSRQIPIERIPETQKAIIKTAKSLNCKVYVATNLLESMITQPNPTRAEVNDIYNTLIDGADGLVLAAETAIGKHPIACTSMVVKIIKNYEKPQKTDPLAYPSDPISLLIEPHGGNLIQRKINPDESQLLEKIPTLNVSDTSLLDCEQITQGTYSPLSGFMDKETCEAVLETNRLPNGTIWTMPILLATTKSSLKNFGVGDKICLVGKNKKKYAIINVTDIFTLKLEKVAKKWFGTTSKKHPGVDRLYKAGNNFIGGDVKLIERLPSTYRHYELTPVQSRYIFAHKGWSKVIGFHTRNPVHRGHEYIQLLAMEQTGADGIYINPVIGPKKTGDFMPGPIMLSYQTMLEFGLYPKGKVVLGSFATYSRYAGPREAAFTALCRKNMGCSYFIIGRDHTGISDFYAKNANQEYIENLGDIGIQPLFFDPVGYDIESARHSTFSNKKEMISIDGTQVRNALLDGKNIPDWIMRDIIQDTLRTEIALNRPLFIK